MLPVFLIGFSVSSHAAIYNWFPHFNMELTKEGDGTSFSDPLNWATAEQPDPSQPPGAGDTASLSSGATVTAGGVSVSKLNGLGTATLTLNGSFSAQSVAGGGMMLKGSGLLTAQTVTSFLDILGGHLLANNYTGSSLSVDSGGSLKITGSVQSPGPFQSFLFNVDGGATLEIQGAANDVDGSIQGGAHAMLANLANLNTSQATLDVSGNGTALTISGDSHVRNGSLDINSGAAVTVNSSLSFQGANAAGTSTSASSFWQGAGTTVTIGTGLTIGEGTGDYTVGLRTGAQIASSAGIVLGSDSGASGTLTLTEGADVELGGSSMIIGQLGLGTVTLDSAAQIVAGKLSVGRSALNNQLTAGLDTILGVVNELVVGEGGQGTLHLQSGAKAVVKRLVVGRSSTADNVATLEGTGTLLSGSGRIDVGELNGRGTFEIKSGAQANPRGGLSVGIYDGSTGTLRVRDGAQITTTNAAIFGGGAASHAMATLQNGGQLAASDVLIFAKPSGTSTTLVTASLSDATATLLLATGQIDVGFSHDATGPTLLQVTNGGFASAGSGLFVGNNGVFDTRGGSTKVGGADFPPDGTVRVGLNGFLGGSGSVFGKVEVDNGGTVAPGASPGILSVQGNYQMNAGGRLEIEVSGTVAGSDYDSVHVTGSASITGGILIIHFINGFSPRNGQSYTFLEASGGISGSFTNIQLTGVASGFAYHLGANGTGTLGLQADSDGVATSSPFLQIARTNSSIILSWPAPGTWVLESATNLPATWATVSATPLVQSNRFVVALPITPPSSYFRLRP